jgi:hypothetical protein
MQYVPLPITEGDGWQIGRAVEVQAVRVAGIKTGRRPAGMHFHRQGEGLNTASSTQKGINVLKVD